VDIVRRLDQRYIPWTIHEIPRTGVYGTLNTRFRPGWGGQIWILDSQVVWPNTEGLRPTAEALSLT